MGWGARVLPMHAPNLLRQWVLVGSPSELCRNQQQGLVHSGTTDRHLQLGGLTGSDPADQLSQRHGRRRTTARLALQLNFCDYSERRQRRHVPPHAARRVLREQEAGAAVPLRPPKGRRAPAQLCHGCLALPRPPAPTLELARASPLANSEEFGAIARSVNKLNCTMAHKAQRREPQQTHNDRPPHMARTPLLPRASKSVTFTGLVIAISRVE